MESKKIKKHELHFALADLYSQKKDYPLANQQYQQSLSYLLINTLPLTEKLNPEPESKFRSKADAIKVLLAKAQALNKWASKSKNEEHLILALETFQFASQLTDQLRKNLQSETSKLFLNSTSADFYEEAIGLSKYLFDLTKKEKYLEDAFYFMEKSKAVYY